MNAVSAAQAVSPNRPISRSATAMAPALMKGLRGVPCSNSSCTSELKAVPDGSRPMRDHSASSLSFCMASVSVKTLEMLWIENGCAPAPATASCPSRVRSAMPICPAGTRASAGM